MPSIDIDLGSIGLVSTNPALRLSLSNCARCSCTDETFNPEELSHAILEQYSKTRPWFRLSSSFDFCLAFRADETVPLHIWEALQETLPAAIETAEIWKHLGFLLAQSTVLKAEDETAFSLTLRLVHDPSEPAQTGRRIPHKIQIDVPSSHVRPPAGVPIVTIDRVDLFLSIASSQGSLREKRQSFPSDLFTIQNLRDSRTSSQKLVSSFQNDFKPPSSRKSASQRSPPIDLLQTIHALISSALLTSISSHPRNLSTRIKLSTNLAFKSLDSLFPSLFAPSFLSTVAQKAKFIPTINSALLNCAKRAQRRKGNSTLALKVAELQRRAAGSRSPDGDGDGDAERKEGVSIGVWSMLQRETAGKTIGMKMKGLFSVEKKEKKVRGSQKTAISSLSQQEISGEMHVVAGEEEDGIMSMMAKSGSSLVKEEHFSRAAEVDEMMYMMKGSSSPVKMEYLSQQWSSQQQDPGDVVEELMKGLDDDDDAFWENLINGNDEDDRRDSDQDKENEPPWPQDCGPSPFIVEKRMPTSSQSTVKEETSSQPTTIMPFQSSPPSGIMATKPEKTESQDEAAFWDDLIMGDTAF